MVKLVVSGSLGRMGQRITQLASEDRNFKLVSLLENPNHPQINTQAHGLWVTSDPASLKGAQALIEFTTPEATISNLSHCLKYGVNMVIGTTGLTEDKIKKIKTASQKIAVVYSSNMSVGVNIFFKLAKEAAQKFGIDYQFKIIEAHHIHKKDAPSGTAKTIAQVVEQGSKRKVTDIQSIREGEIIGDHDLFFESAVDTLVIRHHAKTRDIFAKGALVAAQFVAKKKSGLFDMQDVLGLK